MRTWHRVDFSCTFCLIFYSMAKYLQFFAILKSLTKAFNVKDLLEL